MAPPCSRPLAPNSGHGRQVEEKPSLRVLAKYSRQHGGRLGRRRAAMDPSDLAGPLSKFHSRRPRRTDPVVVTLVRLPDVVQSQWESQRSRTWPGFSAGRKLNVAQYLHNVLGPWSGARPALVWATWRGKVEQHDPQTL
jgi:hypothetical protein